MYVSATGNLLIRWLFNDVISTIHDAASVKWWRKDNFELMWKEAVVDYSMYHPNISEEKNKESFSENSRPPDKFRCQYLPYRKLEY
jgi:hypothetical protein